LHSSAADNAGSRLVLSGASTSLLHLSCADYFDWFGCSSLLPETWKAHRLALPATPLVPEPLPEHPFLQGAEKGCGVGEDTKVNRYFSWLPVISRKGHRFAEHFPFRGTLNPRRPISHRSAGVSPFYLSALGCGGYSPPWREKRFFCEDNKSVNCLVSIIMLKWLRCHLLRGQMSVMFVCGVWRIAICLR